MMYYQDSRWPFVSEIEIVQSVPCYAYFVILTTNATCYLVIEAFSFLKYEMFFDNEFPCGMLRVNERFSISLAFQFNPMTTLN